ncbi:metal-dependent transcriptional regulator [Alkaliphilus transvaalensis]|uniref:metal-dependent transcriptional regulator n=1 Tax=Alkaliphilus transvaalensis TaxID=114628 RepID=UPI00047935AA|nr:iron dependent repressor, metal binding and dimerization domain protein [Alkaliphilus transvaalensis]
MAESKEFYTARGYEIAALNEKALSPSMEDYIEMIYRLSIDRGYVRVNDLANKLNVQPPSVTKMVGKLKQRGLLKYEKYGLIHLTAEGSSLATYLLERHNTVKAFLVLIEATDQLQKNVEMLEHYISFKTYRGISALLEFMKDNPMILEKFYKYLEEIK